MATGNETVYLAWITSGAQCCRNSHLVWLYVVSTRTFGIRERLVAHLSSCSVRGEWPSWSYSKNYTLFFFQQEDSVLEFSWTDAAVVWQWFHSSLLAGCFQLCFSLVSSCSGTGEQHLHLWAFTRAADVCLISAALGKPKQISLKKISVV